jgi:hypothetical protein
MAGQPTDALRKANEARTLRSDLRRRIAADEACAAAVIGDPIPWWLDRLPLGDFLRWPFKMEPQTLRSILAEAQVSEGRLLGVLTERQRSILAEALDVREEARRKGRGRQEIIGRRGRAEAA